MAIVKKYEKEQLDIFPQLFAQMATALTENPRQDYLGDMFMQLGLANSKAGQVFTPYHVADLMASLTFDEVACGHSVDKIHSVDKSKPYISVYEPACGAGVMLIAAIDKMKQLGKDPGTTMILAAQELSYPVAVLRPNSPSGRRRICGCWKFFDRAADRRPFVRS